MLDSKNILALLGIPVEDVEFCDCAELGEGSSIIELTLVKKEEKVHIVDQQKLLFMDIITFVSTIQSFVLTKLMCILRCADINAKTVAKHLNKNFLFTSHTGKDRVL